MTDQTPPPPPPAAPSGSYGVPVGGYQAPAGGYQIPVGYQVPAHQAPQAEQPRSRVFGTIALILSLIAAVVVPVLGGVFGYQIGMLLPTTEIDVASSFNDDLAMLSPARMQVLWAEIAFWTGTVLGVLALVLGIMAVVKRQGRGAGITAIVLAALGPVFFVTAVLVMLGIGAAVGTASV